MRALEEHVPPSVRPTILPSTPMTAKHSRLPISSPSPWTTAFQPTWKRFATPRTIRKLQFGATPFSYAPYVDILLPPTEGLQCLLMNHPGNPVRLSSRQAATGRLDPKTTKREPAKRKELNLPAPALFPSIPMASLPSTNLSAMFGDIDMTMDQGGADILPLFTSRWGTPHIFSNVSTSVKEERLVG